MEDPDLEGVEAGSQPLPHPALLGTSCIQRQASTEDPDPDVEEVL